jgi:hypothetical protein
LGYKVSYDKSKGFVVKSKNDVDKIFKRDCGDDRLFKEAVEEAKREWYEDESCEDSKINL